VAVRSPTTTLLRRLPIEEALAPKVGGRHRLRTTFSQSDLVILGLGVTIGAGIFSLAGKQAAANAGPAVLLSFGFAAIACLLAGLCYAELASVLPVAGSAYTFTYVIFGEIWGWLIGWSLLLEVLLAVAVVSRVWSQYAVATLADFDLDLPAGWDRFAGGGADVDLLAVGVVVVSMLSVLASTRMSLRVLWTAVLGKLGIIGLVVVVGALHVRSENYTPLLPAKEPVRAATDPSVLQALAGQAPDAFGVIGVFTAAAVVFFAFIGFDIVATAAEEAEDPRKTVPRGIIQTVVISAVLYLAVALVLVGMRPYAELGGDAPVSEAFRAVGADVAARLVGVGALIGLTTVIFVVLIGASRIVFAMARDGLLPTGIGKVSPRLGTPARATFVIGSLAVVLSVSVPVLRLAEMVNIGTLVVFLFVAIGVLVLRRSRPALERGFRVPASPLVPILAILFTLWLLLNLRVATWGYFSVWAMAGLWVYLAYGRRHSGLGLRLANARIPEQRRRRAGAHRAPR
jgi:basic amino acid/polyamine antiporter, APA family